MIIDENVVWIIRNILVDWVGKGSVKTEEVVPSELLWLFKIGLKLAGFQQSMKYDFVELTFSREFWKGKNYVGMGDFESKISSKSFTHHILEID